RSTSSRTPRPEALATRGCTVGGDHRAAPSSTAHPDRTGIGWWDDPSPPGPKMTDDSEYRRKRDFERTPEPPATEVSGDVDPLTAPPGETFVIQQHYATRLHHDVRLEMFNGPAPVLVSWAVPKGLPRARGERHLAIRTEDHPMEYATFSGTIPAGEYGGGEVRIFDSGTYEMVGRTEDRITFRLHG